VELDFHILQTIPVDQSTLLDLVPSTAGPSHGPRRSRRRQIRLDAGADRLWRRHAVPGHRPDAGYFQIRLTPMPPMRRSKSSRRPTARRPPWTTPIVWLPPAALSPTTMTISGQAKGVLANDTDAKGPMNAVLVGGSAITVGADTINGIPTATYTQSTVHGSVRLNALDGSFSYTPAAGFTGSDSFTYRAVMRSATFPARRQRSPSRSAVSRAYRKT